MPITDALSRQIDVSPWVERARRRATDRPLEVALWLGVALRAWVYLQGRSYWMDEGSLLSNLEGRAPFDFTGPLKADQLAPPGFLVAERLLVGAFGGSPYVTRLLPLLSGLAALWLFRSLAERTLAIAPAVVGMILFAMGDDLVYYSNELKPYSTDLAVGLWITLLVSGELNGPNSPGRRLALATTVVIAPWASFVSAFVIAGCGMVLLADRLQSGRHREVIRWTLVAVAWGLSAAVAYRISRRLLGPATTMYVFWDFAFPPIPPRSLADLAKTAGILLETFVTPLNLIPPMIPYASAAIVGALLILGGIRMARRDGATLAILLTPALLALAASAARKYPFHGRLILWTAPALIILIAEGCQAAGARLGRRAFLAIAAVLLAYPTANTLYNAVPPLYRDFNPHGDLRRNRFMD